MMMMRTDRVDVINDERQRSCSGARSNPAHRPTEDDIEALREREAIPRGDSHSDDRRWKMNSKDEKEEEEEEEEEEEDGAKEAADNQFDDSVV